MTHLLAARALFLAPPPDANPGEIMRHLRAFLIMFLFAVLMSGCFGPGPEELFDTAQLEEQQLNPTHALELYQELVSKHPDSEQADIARERVKVLQKAISQ